MRFSSDSLTQNLKEKIAFWDIFDVKYTLYTLYIIYGFRFSFLLGQRGLQLVVGFLSSYLGPVVCDFSIL